MTLRPMQTKDAYLLESAEGKGRMSFRRYEEYRDSGVEWVGEVPVGWMIEKLKFVAEVQPSNVDKKVKENEEEVLLCNYTDVYYNEEITGDLPFMKATASDLQIRKFTLKSGDIIITKDSEDPNDIAVSAYVPQDLEGIICGYHLALLRPKDRILGWYLKRVMDSRYARSFFATRANGLTRYGLGIYAINNFFLPLPPLKEQKQIAAYLDRETAKIDSLVAKQEQLIELLREKRQAVISHAVTKGLNPNAQMKDSGVEWLGKVPAEWTVKKLKNVCSQSALYGANIASSHYEGEGVRFLRTTDISDDGALKNGGVFVHATLVEDYMLNDGDLLISRSGTVGRSFLYKSQHHGPCAYAGYLVRFVPSSDVLPEYLLLFTKTQAFHKFLQVMAISSTIENVNGEKYANAPFCIPPLQEQSAIATFLEKETAKIDILIEKCETAIKLLKERRTALISAAVTGKIDVRDKGQ